jgi:hypothetical protein
MPQPVHHVQKHTLNQGTVAKLDILVKLMTKRNFWAKWILWSIIHFKFHVFSKMYGVKREQKLKPL